MPKAKKVPPAKMGNQPMRSPGNATLRQAVEKQFFDRPFLTVARELIGRARIRLDGCEDDRASPRQDQPRRWLRLERQATEDNRAGGRNVDDREGEGSTQDD